MKRLSSLIILITSVPLIGIAQISVHPTGVNINASGSTVVLLTYGSLRPADALWCGELENAFPHEGSRCHPATIYGSLPVTLDQSRFSG